MTYRDFFRLLIKLFGLFGIVTGLFVTIGQLYSYTSVDPDVYQIVFFISTVILLMAFFYALIIKSDLVISMFRLERGFENKEIPFQDLNPKNILEIGIVLIGLLLFIDAIPDLLFDLFVWISLTIKANESGLASLFNSTSQTNIGYYFLKTLIGYLLVSNFDRVSSYLMPKISDGSRPD